MQDVFYVEDLEQAKVLMKPVRVEILQQLGEPRTCVELADFFNDTAQRIYYHVKALEKAGLVQKQREQKVRGLVESYYQATARSYWLSPQLVGRIGGKQITQDQVSLRYLLDLTEEMHAEIGRLGHTSDSGKHVPSLSLSGTVFLADKAQRIAFLDELQTAFHEIARKYGIGGGDETSNGESYRLVLACYPKQISYTTQKGNE